MADIFVSKDTSTKKDQPVKKSTQEMDFLLPGETKIKPGRMLSSFVFHPKHADFFDRDPEEKVILILRKHPVTNLKWIVMGVILLIAPFVVSYVTNFSFLPFRFYLVSLLGWYMLSFAYVFENFLNWFFSVNIITDKRVIDVEFLNLVYRQVSDCEHRQIQDVTVKIGSVIRTIFNYGDILIQTAAEIPEIEFEAVPQPDRIDKILRQLRIMEESERA
jgi:hypothetical protein